MCHQSAVCPILGWIRIRILCVDGENDSVGARVAAAVYVSAREDGEFIELLALAIREIEFPVVSEFMWIAAWKSGKSVSVHNPAVRSTAALCRL
jgi:hypothetical protein